MLNQLEQAFRFDQANLSLRAQRQQVLASNIANADTPNYKARDFDFGSVLDSTLSTQANSQAPQGASGLASGATSVAQALAQAGLQYRTPSQDSIDGNTVDMDLERGAFADNAIRYEAGLTATNSKIRTLLLAVQG